MADKKIAEPLHRRVHAALLHDIEQRIWRPGERLPSEEALCRRFGASRITVNRAIQDLQRAGLVRRRVGSGTYVEAPAAEGGAPRFGLLIPELGGTEIFEPICQGMAASRQARGYSLSWGSLPGAGSRAEAAAELGRQYIREGAAGVFFAAMEHAPDSEQENRKILAALAEAHVPVVLLDRMVSPFPLTDPYDCVGINHFAAGFEIAEHLLRQGAEYPAFVARPFAAVSVAARYAGFRRAVHGPLWELEPDDSQAVDALLRSRPDAIVCANDITAAMLMRTLQRAGVRVPEDVRMAGFDDVRYAQFLPVPLTTIRQDCPEIGAAAMAVMLDRVERPDRPARTVYVAHQLVVRASCGAARP